MDLPDLAIGGMVHVSKLSQTFVRWDAAREALADGRQTWQVGTKMKVRVAAVDFDQRKIDFEPVVSVPPSRGGKRPPRKSQPKGRSPRRRRS